MNDLKTELTTIYQRLFSFYGPRNWWPAESWFEVVIGTILTQSVTWNSVERSISQLKEHNLIDIDKISRMDETKLYPFIKTTRFYQRKANTIKNFCYLYQNEYENNIENMINTPINRIREDLLNLKGIGRETADSILLYALNKPIFVVDSYTKRIFYRYGYFHEKSPYRHIQCFFMKNIKKDILIYNDFHAQIVNLGNSVCRTNPKCLECPINRINKQIGCNYFLHDFDSN